MRHNVAGRKLKRTASHKRSLMANLATALFEHKRLTTTVAKAKELRPFAEHLITRAKNAHVAERSGAIKGLDVHSRRMVGRFIRNKAVLQELFDSIAPLVAERNGGYTRIVKLGIRRGDNAPEAMIELVDWSNPVDGRVSSTTRAKAPAKPKRPLVRTAPAAPAVAAPVADVAAPVVETDVEETAAPETAVAEAPAADTAVAESPAAAPTGDDAPAADAADQSTENA
ncbi:MAG: 50S ribosomal protein L17 [Candidatus Kapabacteria bacterium]|jgi:large subunit ribosomal protein L17|nr:50S ribosomal protein L17 [Candidatus Kapabacteria bacterium]